MVVVVVGDDLHCCCAGDEACGDCEGFHFCLGEGLELKDG